MDFHQPAIACLKPPVDRSAGGDPLRPTQPIASRTRDGLGAGFLKQPGAEVGDAALTPTNTSETAATPGHYSPVRTEVG